MNMLTEPRHVVAYSTNGDNTTRRLVAQENALKELLTSIQAMMASIAQLTTA